MTLLRFFYQFVRKAIRIQHIPEKLVIVISSLYLLSHFTPIVSLNSHHYIIAALIITLLNMSTYALTLFFKTFKIQKRTSSEQNLAKKEDHTLENSETKKDNSPTRSENQLETIIENTPHESYPFILNLNKENPTTYILPELPSKRSQIVIPSELHHFVETFLDRTEEHHLNVKCLKSHDLPFLKSHLRKINPTPFQIIETRDSDNDTIFNLN